MKTKKLAGLLGLLSLAMLTAPGRTDNAGKPAFAASDIRAQIEYLASDKLRGRGSGEVGNEEAARFIAKEFARLNLKPVGTAQQRDLKAVPNGSGYFQPFAVSAGRLFGKSSRLEVVWKGRAINYRPNQEFEPAGVSSAGKAEGEIVFVGYGVQSADAKQDDYAGLDVKGKIVLALAGRPEKLEERFADVRLKARDAKAAGAVGLIIVLPRELGAMHKSLVADGPDMGLPTVRVRSTLAEAWLKAANLNLEALAGKAAKGESVSTPLGAFAKLAVEVSKVERPTANILGVLPGSDPVLKEEYLIIGAHMDHLGMGGVASRDSSGKPAIHHGADDNASGTAGVLQLAAYFRKVGAPKRSLVFICFSGEEMGLLGSRHYTANPILPLDKTVGMLNMDMIGRLRNDKLIVGGADTAKEWGGLITEANKTTAFDVSRSDGLFEASDHYSFYEKNLPCLFFFTNLHEDYHRPSDTADKINYDGEARILQMVAACAEATANAPTRFAFQPRKQAVAQGPRMRGGRAYFGSIPDYAGNVEGVLLSGVRDGSPAQKGGIKGGDIIVKFGEKDVRNIEEYTLALQDYKPGDTVKVTVKRGAETLVLTVTLAERKAG